MRPFLRLSHCLRWRYLAACCLSTAIALLLLVGPPPPTPMLAYSLRAFHPQEIAEINGTNTPSPAKTTLTLTTIAKSSNSSVPKGIINKNETSNSSRQSVPKSVSPPVFTNSSSNTTNATTPRTTTPSTPHPPVTTTTPALAIGEVFKESTRHPVQNNLPIIYAITPTYKRMEQMAELTRLAQTLMHVSALHWIVVEDANTFSDSVKQLLKRSGLNYTHMLGPKPARYNRTPAPPVTKKMAGKKKGPPPIPRGVSNRLAALRWIKANVKEGVLYFADDDNTYDVRLFEEMRWTKKVSMWPVGLVTQFAVSSPVVKDGKVVSFYDGWVAGRKFPVDMAGFAVNIQFLLQKPNVTMPFVVGYEEDGFLKSLQITMNDIEPKADNCTQILVWHTKTVKNTPPKKMSKKDLDKYNHTNIMDLCRIIS